MVFVLEKVENIVGKGENSSLPAISLFSPVFFQTPYFQGLLKSGWFGNVAFTYKVRLLILSDSVFKTFDLQLGESGSIPSRVKSNIRDSSDKALDYSCQALVLWCYTRKYMNK